MTRRILTLSTLLLGLFAVAPAAHADSLTWSGRVDGDVVLYLRGNRVSTQTESGRSPLGTRVDWRGQLPSDNVRLSVRQREGRGQVDVIQQPNRRNNYTAAVRISDPHGGADNYIFTIFWNERGNDRVNGGWNDRKDRWGYGYSATPHDRYPRDFDRDRYRNNDRDRYGNNDRNDRNDRFGQDGDADGRLFWSGRVDDKVVVYLRGESVRTETRSGGAVASQRSTVQGRLSRNSRTVTLSQTRGRGQIQVIQQPNANNDYTVAVQIYDPESGSDNYAFTLAWD